MRRPCLLCFDSVAVCMAACMAARLHGCLVCLRAAQHALPFTTHAFPRARRRLHGRFGRAGASAASRSCFSALASSASRAARFASTSSTSFWRSPLRWYVHCLADGRGLVGVQVARTLTRPGRQRTGRPARFTVALAPRAHPQHLSWLYTHQGNRSHKSYTLATTRPTTVGLYGSPDGSRPNSTRSGLVTPRYAAAVLLLLCCCCCVVVVVLL